MKKINMTVIIIVGAATLLLTVALVLVILGSRTTASLPSRIIASIETILADWEQLEQETSKITITPDMTALYTPESLIKLCKLLGGDEELQISVYYTNCFNTYNESGQIITEKDYIGIPFIDNEGFNIYYYFMVTPNDKVYDIISGPWK